MTRSSSLIVLLASLALIGSSGAAGGGNLDAGELRAFERPKRD